MALDSRNDAIAANPDSMLLLLVSAPYTHVIIINQLFEMHNVVQPGNGLALLWVPASILHQPAQIHHLRLELPIRIVMPLAADGPVLLWTGFKFTAHEYRSFSCLLCTANVSSWPTPSAPILKAAFGIPTASLDGDRGRGEDHARPADCVSARYASFRAGLPDISSDLEAVLENDKPWSPSQEALAR